MSFWAWWLSLSGHGSAALALIVVPWPDGYRIVLTCLLFMVLLEWLGSCRRISHYTGEIVLLEEGMLRWRQQLWRVGRRPWTGDLVIFLILKGQQSETEYLWLMRDSMSARQWRQLHQLLLNSQG